MGYIAFIIFVAENVAVWWKPMGASPLWLRILLTVLSPLIAILFSMLIQRIMKRLWRRLSPTELLWAQFWTACDKHAKTIPKRDLPRMLELFDKLKNRSVHFPDADQGNLDLGPKELRLAQAAAEIAEGYVSSKRAEHDKIKEWLEISLAWIAKSPTAGYSRSRDCAYYSVCSAAKSAGEPLLFIRANEGNSYTHSYMDLAKDAISHGAEYATQVVSQLSRQIAARTIYASSDLRQIAVAFATRSEVQSLDPLKALIMVAHQSAAAIESLLILLKRDDPDIENPIVTELVRIAKTGIREIETTSRPGAYLDLAECFLRLKQPSEAESCITSALGATATANLGLWQQVDEGGRVIHERNDQGDLKRGTSRHLNELRELARSVRSG